MEQAQSGRRHIALEVDRTHAPRALKANEFSGLASATEVVINSAPLRMVIKKGAFLETLAGDQQVALLWQHDITEPIGVPTYLNETDRGLEFIARVADTARGRDAMTLLRDDGMANQGIPSLSIGFNPTEFHFEEVDGEMLEVVTALDLMEISVVTFGANPLAEVRDVNGARDYWEGRPSDPLASRYLHALDAIPTSTETHPEELTEDTRARHLDSLRDAVDFIRNDLDPLTEDTMQLLRDATALLRSITEREERDHRAGDALAELTDAALYHAGTVASGRNNNP